jgi:hypothetical protein
MQIHNFINILKIMDYEIYIYIYIYIYSIALNQNFCPLGLFKDKQSK